MRRIVSVDEHGVCNAMTRKKASVLRCAVYNFSLSFLPDSPIHFHLEHHTTHKRHSFHQPSIFTTIITDKNQITLLYRQYNQHQPICNLSAFPPCPSIAPLDQCADAFSAQRLSSLPAPQLLRLGIQYHGPRRSTQPPTANSSTKPNLRLLVQLLCLAMDSP
jgi:hypothetical protein